MKGGCGREVTKRELREWLFKNIEEQVFVIVGDQKLMIRDDMRVFQYGDFTRLPLSLG